MAKKGTKCQRPFLVVVTSKTSVEPEMYQRFTFTAKEALEEVQNVYPNFTGLYFTVFPTPQTEDVFKCSPSISGFSKWI